MRRKTLITIDSCLVENINTMTFMGNKDIRKIRFWYYFYLLFILAPTIHIIIIISSKGGRKRTIGRRALVLCILFTSTKLDDNSPDLIFLFIMCFPPHTHWKQHLNSSQNNAETFRIITGKGTLNRKAINWHQGVPFITSFCFTIHSGGSRNNDDIQINWINNGKFPF